MSKLTKEEARRHAEAEELLKKDTLSLDERLFVLEHWHEGARHINSVAGAFFTPLDLARDFAVEVPGRKIIDLCAGIGRLAFMVQLGCSEDFEITCIEQNPDYVAVGRKLLPNATWICMDVFDIPKKALGRFDAAISNPPFGATPRGRSQSPRYTGSLFEYHVIDIASDLARFGTFIIPQGSASFRYSGCQSFRQEESESYKVFQRTTGITLGANCGLDTSSYRKQWRGASPMVEIVTADFGEVQAARQANSQDLFSLAPEQPIAA